jgi:Uncharacterized low-complexity proteins
MTQNDFTIPNSDTVSPSDIQDGADLSDADLTNADLKGATLIEADLTDAHLSYADVREAEMSTARVVKVNITLSEKEYLTESHLSLMGAYVRRGDEE